MQTRLAKMVKVRRPLTTRTRCVVFNPDLSAFGWRGERVARCKLCGRVPRPCEIACKEPRPWLSPLQLENEPHHHTLFGFLNKVSMRIYHRTCLFR
jgi:hypothetical protein